MNIYTKLVLASATLLFMAGFASSTVVINSQDWRDVHTGLQYANQNDERSFFLTSSDPTRFYNVLPRGEPITLIESDDNYISNFEGQLESRDYEVDENIREDNLNTQILDSETYIVVDSGSPSSSVAAAPLANVLNGSILIAGSENLDLVDDKLASAEQVIKIGKFSRDTSNVVDEYATEEYSSSNVFRLSTNIAERVQQEKSSNKALFTDGSTLESDLIRSESPVLMVGNNLLPEQTIKFLKESDINTAIFIGRHLSVIGEELSETMSDDFQIFVKYGQANEDSSIQKLGQFPLPSDDLELGIDSARYNPNEEKLYVTYSNDGAANLYQLSSIALNNDGETLGSVADEEAQFIGSGSSLTKDYSVSIDSEKVKGLKADFTTSYGPNPEDLETYVTPEESGVFSPPFSINVTLGEINDSSDIELKSVSYLTDLNRFKGVVENEGEVPADFRLNLIDVVQKGLEESISSDKETVQPGETQTIYITAELDQIDLQENKRLNAEIVYGEESLLNSQSKDLKFNSKSSSLIGSFTSSPTKLGAAIVVIVLLGVVGLYRFRPEVLESLR